jgi:hypothetical protein
VLLIGPIGIVPVGGRDEEDVGRRRSVAIHIGFFFRRDRCGSSFRQTGSAARRSGGDTKKSRTHQGAQAIENIARRTIGQCISGSKGATFRLAANV